MKILAISVIIFNCIGVIFTQEECLSSCLKSPTTSPNTWKCCDWKLNKEGDCESTQCTEELGMDYNSGIDIEFVYQPGFYIVPRMYYDKFSCVWHVGDLTNCRTGTFMILQKDFHIRNVNERCECEDHLEVNYRNFQRDYLCGPQDLHNCPSSNCVDIPIISNTPMTITFKSDLEDYSTGFFGLVIISNIRNCQTSARHLRQVSDGILDNITNIVDIAPNILEDIEIIEDNLCEVMECACDGSCIVEGGDGYSNFTDIEMEKAREITFSKTIHLAYAYANSLNIFLRRVSRKCIKNWDLYGTIIPPWSLLAGC